jgi:hypothetical protein
MFMKIFRCVRRFTGPALIGLVISVNAFAQNPAGDGSAWIEAKGKTYTFYFTNADKTEVASIKDYLSLGHSRVTKFFSKKFPRQYAVKVFPDRKSLTAFWRTAWGAPDFEPECWMVASGDDKTLAILSPRVWKTEACEHDPVNKVDTQALITHELVHVFHSQVSPKPSFEGMDNLGWFIEGLAVYGSGQLDIGKMANAFEAVETGKDPSELKNAWSGKYRYGVSGSIVKFLGDKVGKDTLLEMMRQTTQDGILGLAGVSEKQLLDQWKALVRSSARPGDAAR